MPYRWTETDTEKELTLWAHQSMTPAGFVWFIGITAAMISLPLFSVLGTAVAWVLLAFFVVVVAALWRAINANQSHMSLHEELTLRDDTVRLEHIPGKGPTLAWEANPYWVSVHLHNDGPVKNYLTLRGNGREVELGRFLTPEERKTLHGEVSNALRSA